METRLTEFSYGYCVTEEFANGMGAGLKAAPYFPSLYVEGKAGGGFDVRIGSAVFLQFKLCQELTRRSARETREGLLNPKFFRFWLHRKDLSDQHKMLTDLEKQPGNQVYYIAPGFADVDALDSSYRSKQVIARSAMFSPGEIGILPDNEDHRVSFRPGEQWGWFLSEPKRIAIHTKEKVIARASGYHLSENGHGVRESLRELADKMEGIIREHRGRYWNADELSSPSQDAQRDPLERAAYLARTHFGAELFLPAEPRPSGQQG
jgi:hypothetical protein